MRGIGISVGSVRERGITSAKHASEYFNLLAPGVSPNGFGILTMAVARTFRLIGGWTEESAIVAIHVKRVRLHGCGNGKTESGGRTQWVFSGGDRVNVK